MGLFGKKTSLGLDIGSGFVKIVEVDRSGDQPEVSRIAMRPLLPDAIVEGEVMDPGLVADTLRGLFQEVGIKGKDVITAVGGHDVIIKKIEMDRMKESEARDVIRWDPCVQSPPVGLRAWNRWLRPRYGWGAHNSAPSEPKPR